MSTCLSTVFKFFLFTGAFVFAMTVSAPRAFGAVIYDNSVLGSLNEITISTEYSMQSGITGLTGGIVAVIYYPSDGVCTLTGSRNPVIRLNNPNAGGDVFNVAVQSVAGGGCRYTRGGTGTTTVISSDVVYMIFPNSNNAYRIYGNFSGGNGSAVIYEFNAQTQTPDSQVSDLALVLCTDLLCDVSPSQQSTRIVSITPSDTSTVSTTTSIGFEVFVSENDFSSTTRMITTYTNDNCNSTSGSVIESIPDFTSSSCRISTTTDILLSGYTIASSTHTWLHGGRWNYVANISNETGTFCLFGNCLFSDQITLATQTGTFVVGQLGAYDILTDYIASSTATDVSTDLSVCAVWTTTGDVFQCFRNLLLPSDSQWKDFFTGYSGAFLTYPPLGYITKVIQILNDPTVVQPPPLSYTFGSSSPAVLQGKNYTIQIFDNFDKVTLPVADDGSGKNIWDIVMPYFRVVVGFAVLFVITMDIIGVGLSSRGGDYATTETGSETVSSSSLLPSGERKSFTHSITKRRRLK